MLQSGLIDAVIVATPHYEHPRLSMLAMRNGIHTLCEKPAGVYTAQVQEMNACARECDVVFGIMYNQRPNPLYQKVKDLIDSGELGEIRRSNWIITNWYRSQSYYNSGGWRATWKGEGGGVLLNQDPHQLDLWQWLVGMPVRLRAFCQFGKHRDIEVEDEVTAYAEYANGATGVFITTVAETQGTNRLEIVGDHGKVVVEEGKLRYWRLRESETAFNARRPGMQRTSRYYRQFLCRHFARRAADCAGSGRDPRAYAFQRHAPLHLDRRLGRPAAQRETVSAPASAAY